MPNISRFTAPLGDLQDYYIFDDFSAEVGTTTDLLWTDSGTGTPTFNVLNTTDNGTINLVTTALANDEAYLATTNATFGLAANREMYFRARVNYQESASNNTGIILGFASAVATGLIVNGVTGLRTTGTIIAVAKLLGETQWRLITRNGTNTTSELSNTTSAASNATTYSVVEIFATDFDGGTNMQITAKVDGEYLRDQTNNLPLRHRRLIASQTNMSAVMGTKAGGAAAETLQVDYVYAAQTRGTPY